MKNKNNFFDIVNYFIMVYFVPAIFGFGYLSLLNYSSNFSIMASFIISSSLAVYMHIRYKK